MFLLFKNGHNCASLTVSGFRQNEHNCAGHNCADWLYWQLNDFGPLESFKPSIILRGQASKWEKAPRKKSERVENPNFDKNKPISEKNIQFHEVFFRDFPVRFSNMTNHVRFFNFNKGWIESWFAFCQFREQPTRGSFSSHLRPDLRLQSLLEPVSLDDKTNSFLWNT